MARPEMRNPATGELGSVLGWDENGDPLFCLLLPEDEFAQWMNQVRYSVDRKTGGVVDLDDLPDWDYRDAFDSEVRPKDAAALALEAAGWERGKRPQHVAPDRVKRTPPEGESITAPPLFCAVAKRTLDVRIRPGARPT